MVRVKGWTRQIVTALAIAMVLMPAYASAQESDGGSAVGSIFKRVVFDPTTYAPAVIAYDGTMRDWNTSQPFFERVLRAERALHAERAAERSAGEL